MTQPTQPSSPKDYSRMPAPLDLTRIRPTHPTRADATADAVAQAEFVERSQG